MTDLNEKLKHGTLSGLEALEYLRSGENVPDAPRNSETPSPLEELLAAPSPKPSVVDPDVAAFIECFHRPGAYTEWIMTRPFRGYGGHHGPARQEREPEPKSTVTRKVGRPRLHDTAADRQRAYRKRRNEPDDVTVAA